MIIGTVKEIKTGENRVGLTPSGAGMLVKSGHKVLVESNAGKNSGFEDAEYRDSGAKVLQSAREVWEGSQMVVKVKEPRPEEYDFLREGMILFTYLHLAAEPELTEVLLEKKVTGIAYETIEEGSAKPLLAPMSEVAGRMAIQKGMYYLERTNGGSGKLLSGVPGVQSGTVTIIGAGVVGKNAAMLARSVGARTIIIDKNISELRKIDEQHKGAIVTLASNPENIEKAVAGSDLVVGSVAVTGASAPKLVTRDMIGKMKPGSVVVDVSIDQGGCFETSRPTSHKDPVYVEEGVTHYCVTNMPGAVPYTSTLALTNATLQYILKIANYGLERAMEDEPIRKGVNTFAGSLTNKAVAESLKLKFSPLQEKGIGYEPLAS